MTVFIDNKSGVPICDQIYTQIKGQIISGALLQSGIWLRICGSAW